MICEVRKRDASYHWKRYTFEIYIRPESTISDQAINSLNVVL